MHIVRCLMHLYECWSLNGKTSAQMSCLCTIKAKNQKKKKRSSDLETYLWADDSNRKEDNVNAAISCQTAVSGQICNPFAFFRLSIHDISNKGDCAHLHQYCMPLLFSSCILLCGVIFLSLFNIIFNPASQCDSHWCKKLFCI